jgi:hypothetical protein
MPAGKLVKVGAWEAGKYIGVVLFGRGANNNIGSPYKLNQVECCELVRIALSKHEAPVSRIAALAMKFLRSKDSGLRLIVSYADPLQGHHGGIYQAGNWIYAGKTKGGTAQIKMPDGSFMHKRTAMSKYGTCKASDLNGTWDGGREKHKYLMPLDKEMKTRILPLSKPYPKRASSETIDTAGNLPDKGGETPTDALHSAEGASHES